MSQCPCGCGESMPLDLSEDEPSVGFDAGGAIEAWVKDQGLTMAELRAPNRVTSMVEARRRVSVYLYRHGWGVTRIGTFLERDHTTVLHLLDKNGGRHAG